MVLLKAPVSPRKCPVARPDEFGMVKVGNSECGLVKLTPLSRTSAIAGAISGDTNAARRPSGTNRMRLRWPCVWALASCRLKAAQAAASRIFDLQDIEVLPGVSALNVSWIRSQQDSLVTGAGYPHADPPLVRRGDSSFSGPHVQAYPHCQSRRNCLPDYQNRASHGHRDGRRLF